MTLESLAFKVGNWYRCRQCDEKYNIDEEGINNGDPVICMHVTEHGNGPVYYEYECDLDFEYIWVKYRYGIRIRRI